MESLLLWVGVSNDILWMDEILHQLIDGFSHSNPVSYSGSYLLIVTFWCEISSIRKMYFREKCCLNGGFHGNNI